MKLYRRSKLESRYRFENGVACIEIRLNNPLQLFDSRDPAPFRERDLEDEATRYLEAALREFPPRLPVKLIIYLREPGNIADEEIIRAIHSYYSYETWLETRKLNMTFRQGQIALVIGLGVLFSFIYLSHQIGRTTHSLLGTMIHEGFNIMGWVAMWKPIDIMLYAWWPIMGTRRLYQRLSDIPIEVRH